MLHISVPFCEKDLICEKCGPLWNLSFSAPAIVAGAISDDPYPDLAKYQIVNFHPLVISTRYTLTMLALGILGAALADASTPRDVVEHAAQRLEAAVEQMSRNLATTMFEDIDNFITLQRELADEANVSVHDLHRTSRRLRSQNVLDFFKNLFSGDSKSCTRASPDGVDAKALKDDYSDWMGNLVNRCLRRNHDDHGDTLHIKGVGCGS